METRAEVVQKWIDARKSVNETCHTVFYITVPHIPENFYKDDQIQRISEMLDRNGVNYQFVDTIPGAWNLNRDWIETEPVESIVEYCGVYPVNWCIDDVVAMEDLDAEGKIVISVFIKDGDKYVPNH